MRHCSKAYSIGNDRFNFLSHLGELNPAQIKDIADLLLQTYPLDLKEGLNEELLQISEFIKQISIDNRSPLNFSICIQKNYSNNFSKCQKYTTYFFKYDGY